MGTIIEVLNFLKQMEIFNILNGIQYANSCKNL